MISFRGFLYLLLTVAAFAGGGWLAAGQLSAKACPLLSNSVDPVHCVKAVAVAKNRVDGCDRLDAVEPASAAGESPAKMACITEIAVRTDNAALCDRVVGRTEADTRADCLLAVARGNGDVGACSALDGGSLTRLGATVDPDRCLAEIGLGTAQTAAVRAAAISGEPEYRHPPGNWMRIESGTRLLEGDEVSADPESRLTLRFMDGSLATIMPGAEAKILTHLRRGDNVRIALRQRIGTVAVLADPKAEGNTDFSVENPSVQVQAVATKFAVDFEDFSGAFTVGVAKGRVVADPTAPLLGSVTVNEGQQVEGSAISIGKPTALAMHTATDDPTLPAEQEPLTDVSAPLAPLAPQPQGVLWGFTGPQVSLAAFAAIALWLLWTIAGIYHRTRPA